MRIAQVAPLYESVPPLLYGGTERVVAYLTEELVRQGHDVTLFASGDSKTSARLEPICERALRLDPGCVDSLPHLILMLERVFAQADRFDLIHFHIDYFHFPLSRCRKVRRVTTLHGRLDLPDLVPLYREFTEEPLISISLAQREPLPWVNWQGMVHHGLPHGLYLPVARPRGDYLAFLGRTSPEKRLDRAIEIAKAVGMKLRVAAKIDAADLKYYRAHIEPLLDDPMVEFIGEIGSERKREFLANAAAVLFPIDWPEPFGLVMIEAMACATPVIAFRCGSVPEIMEEGVTGYIVDTVEDAIDATRRALSLDRRAIRAVFDRRFTADRMAHDYVSIYERLAREPPPARPPHWRDNLAILPRVA
jgi:glycosyltransferase involved in cell wall biosynthesis